MKTAVEFKALFDDIPRNKKEILLTIDEIGKEPLSSANNILRFKRHLLLSNVWLHHTVQRGTKDIVEYAISKTSDVDGREWETNSTPLMEAASCGNIEAFDILIAAGADITATDMNGINVLHGAALNGDTDMFEHILSLNLHEFDFNELSRGDESVYYKNHPDDEDELPEFGDAGRKDIFENEGLSLVHAGCISGSPKILELCIKNGGDVNLPDAYGITPLHYAAGWVHHLIEKLVEHGANPNVKDNDGFFPVHYATNNSRPESIPLLVAAGADINARDRWGKTPLHLAMEHNIVKLIRPLVEHGADIEARVFRNQEDSTPIHFGNAECRAELHSIILSRKLLPTDPTPVRKNGI